MINVEIRGPRIEFIKELHSLFRNVITDTFMNEGKGEKLKDLNDAIEGKKGTGTLKRKMKTEAGSSERTCCVINELFQCNFGIPNLDIPFARSKCIF